MYPVGKLRFPTSLSLALDLLTWYHSTVSCIRHFKVARKTGSRWLSKCIVGLFWGTNLPPCWKCVPKTVPQCILTTISTPVFRGTSKWRPKHWRSGRKKLEWGMMKTRAESKREEMRRKTIHKGILLPWIVILSKISLDKITDREQLGRSRSLHLFHSLQSLNFTLPSLFILVRSPELPG